MFSGYNVLSLGSGAEQCAVRRVAGSALIVRAVLLTGVSVLPHCVVCVVFAAEEDGNQALLRTVARSSAATCVSAVLVLSWFPYVQLST